MTDDMTHIGIDPGAHGAIAFLFANGIDVVDMPTNPRDIYEMLAPHQDATATIERQQAMPRQGVSSTFKTGYGYGVIVGVLASLGIPYREVGAGTWKRALGLVGTDKEASRALARSQWPTAPLSRKKDEGRAEALLIAEFGRRQR